MWGSRKKFHITEDDKEWVHNSFAWLIKAYGYPEPEFTPILFTAEFFPITINHKQTAIAPLLADLCNLFDIGPEKISFKIEEDIRDTRGTPYEMQGSSFECELELIKSDNEYHYKLIFAKSLLRTPKRLVFNAVFQFIQINLSNTDIEWIGNEKYHFLFYLIGVYTGYGVILAQTMIDIGKESELFWERSWKYVSPMPVPVMAYSMALYSSMIEEKSPAWKKFLPSDMRVQYEMAAEFIDNNHNLVFDKQKLTAHILFKEASQQADQKKFDLAIETYQKIIFLTGEDSFKVNVYNNTGYAFLCKAEFEKSIPYFLKALEISSHASYANDNLSFAFFMLGDTDTGMHYHSIAAQTGKRIKAYSYRNLAIYHQKRGETEKARLYFKKAFENITIPVDWLEYLYARFLFEQEETEESLVYLKIAVEKGEPQAIQWMNDINKSL